MPAAIPAGIAAISTASVASIATGVAVAGAAVQAVGMITGSKTLQKVGGMGSMVGGLGMGASMMSGAGGATAGAAAGASPWTSTGATPGTTAAQGNLFGSNATGGGLFSSGAGVPAAAGGAAQGASAIPTMDRIKDVLTRYDTTANVLGGIGQGYMMHQTEKMRQQVPRMQHQLDQDKFNQMQLNRDARTTIPNLRDMQSTGGLLRGQ